jgi:hypothetical protein
MAVPTIYRISQEISKLLNGGNTAVASQPTINEIKIAVAQVANTLLKTEHLSVNEKLGEKIPGGSVLATYEGLLPVPYGAGRCKVKLPVKPIKLPLNMGVFQVYRSEDPYNEFIPLQMGQANLLRSQPVINDILGQVGYENFGMDIILTQDLLTLYEKPRDREITLRLVVVDISQLDDFDPLPITPEIEWTIKQEVVKLYSGQPIADKVIDNLTKPYRNVPPNQQKQA